MPDRRRYRLAGLSAAQIAKAIGPDVTVVGMAGGSIDIDVGATPGFVDEVDMCMAMLGYSFEAAGSTDTTLRLTSPDGTDWLVSVSDLGVLSVAAVA